MKASKLQTPQQRGLDDAKDDREGGAVARSQLAVSGGLRELNANSAIVFSARVRQGRFFSTRRLPGSRPAFPHEAESRVWK